MEFFPGLTWIGVSVKILRVGTRAILKSPRCEKRRHVGDFKIALWIDPNNGTRSASKHVGGGLPPPHGPELAGPWDPRYPEKLFITSADGCALDDVPAAAIPLLDERLQVKPAAKS